MTISPAQCRAARTLLSWSVAKLASAATVSARAIEDFELERRALDLATRGAIRRAFEEVGAAFLPGDDVRLEAAAAPDNWARRRLLAR
jgi:transcriptional regulator with XRE-family HTH domain